MTAQKGYGPRVQRVGTVISCPSPVIRFQIGVFLIRDSGRVAKEGETLGCGRAS